MASVKKSNFRVLLKVKTFSVNKEMIKFTNIAFKAVDLIVRYLKDRDDNYRKIEVPLNDYITLTINELLEETNFNTLTITKFINIINKEDNKDYRVILSTLYYYLCTEVIEILTNKLLENTIIRTNDDEADMFFKLREEVYELFFIEGYPWYVDKYTLSKEVEYFKKLCLDIENIRSNKDLNILDIVYSKTNNNYIVFCYLE